MTQYKTGGLAVALLVTACDGGGGLFNDSTPPDIRPNLFLSAMPPGSNGNSAGGIGEPVSGEEALQFPDHYRDQLDLYGNLAYAMQGLRSETCNPPASIDDHVTASDQACNYFKRADITLAAADAVSTVNLDAPGAAGAVTIRRDGWGVPYVDGATRAAAEFGLGYAAAQDRLWLFDLLRNVGRGRTTEFLGDAPSLATEDETYSRPAGYSEDEITAIVTNAVAKLNAISGEHKLGDVFLNDTQMFVAGMNAWMDSLLGENFALIPPEYATLAFGGNGPPFPPRAFTVNDIVANAILIQSALGLGGGGEARNVRLLEELDAGFGAGATTIPKEACELWRDLRHANAPDTTHSASGVFATQSPPSVDETCPQTLPAGTALWDRGSLQQRPLFRREDSTFLPLLVDVRNLGRINPFKPAPTNETEPPLLSPTDTQLAMSDEDKKALRELIGAMSRPMTASNWIAAAGSQTKSGRPILVAGPQTAYFIPQLLWEAAVISRGGTPLDIAARGISTVNLPYLVIGHGLDFAWSPTSAGSDFTDTRVSFLCNANGSAPSRNDANGDGFPDADGYEFKGACQPFYRRVDEWTAQPTVASVASNGPMNPVDVSRFILRTHYGPVTHTATVGGRPVAISTQRSTFMADVDTAAPFALLTTVGKPMTHTRFKQLFNSMTATFNWLYADKNDIAYIQSGLYPLRHPDVHPELPVWGDGRFEWQVDEGFNVAGFGGNDTADGDDENDGVLSGTVNSWPSRAAPLLADDDPLVGYYEWPGFLPLDAHIQDTNPPAGYLANWNNSGAAGWWAADANGTYGPTHRVTMLSDRLKAFQASGRKHDIASMIEIMADAAYTDHRGTHLLPLLLQILKTGELTADQQTLVTLMQDWLDDGSMQWINGGKGLGAYRRDRDNDGVYDRRAAVVLMDAWYLRLIETVAVQLLAIEGAGASVLTGRLDAPRAQGSAFQEGWYQHMRRMLQTVLNTPGHASYRGLKCAGTGTPADCRAAVIGALDQAVADLGGIAAMDDWDGTQIRYAKSADCGVVEICDEVTHNSFSFIPVPAIHWINRPTFQQVAEIFTDRND